MTTSCPLCHTHAPTILEEELRDDGAWQCTRCGQKWDVIRLATVAAYLRFAVGHP